MGNGPGKGVRIQLPTNPSPSDTQSALFLPILTSPFFHIPHWPPLSVSLQQSTGVQEAAWASLKRMRFLTAGMMFMRRVNSKWCTWPAQVPRICPRGLQMCRKAEHQWLQIYVSSFAFHKNPWHQTVLFLTLSSCRQCYPCANFRKCTVSRNSAIAHMWIPTSSVHSPTCAIPNALS